MILIGNIITISTPNSLKQNGKNSEIDLEDIVSCGTDFLILTELEWSFNVIVIVMDIVLGVNGPHKWVSLMAECVSFGWTIPLINRQIVFLL